MNKYAKEDALEYIITVSERNNLTPNQNTFAGYVIKTCIAKFAMPRADAKKILEMLNVAYRADKWRRFKETLVRPDVIREAPKTQTVTPRTFEDANNEVQQTIAKMTSSNHTPINYAPVKQATQQDRITQTQFTRTLYTIAKHDTDLDNVGRILLSDARDAADNQKLTPWDVIRYWQVSYPTIDIENKSNVLLVYWDGKQETLNRRLPIIQETTPTCHHTDNDTHFTATPPENFDSDQFKAATLEDPEIIEDDEGVVDEEEDAES